MSLESVAAPASPTLSIEFSFPYFTCYAEESDSCIVLEFLYNPGVIEVHADHFARKMRSNRILKKGWDSYRASSFVRTIHGNKFVRYVCTRTDARV